MTDSVAHANGEAAWLTDPLVFLLAPLSVPVFFADYFERRHLVGRARDPRRFAGLLDVSMVEAFIAGTDLSRGMVKLVHRSERVDETAFVDLDDRIIAAAIDERYRDGATIILPRFDRSSPKLDEFCRSLERALSYPVQANAYLTPPGERGFAPHYDTHDLFALQLSGEKSWRLYERRVEAPYRGEGFVLGQLDPGAITETLLLRPGDCLYLPRGMMHDAVAAGEQPSLHVTIGLNAPTWADLMMAAVTELTVSEPAFRRSLPPGFANPGFDRGAAQARFDALAALIAAQVEMDGALDRIASDVAPRRSK